MTQDNYSCKLTNLYDTVLVAQCHKEKDRWIKSFKNITMSILHCTLYSCAKYSFKVTKYQKL